MTGGGNKSKSIKDGGGLHKKKILDQNTHLGRLMNQYSDVDEILYPYVVNSGWVYEEMDFTIEEFAEITGADLKDLLVDLTRIVEKG